MVSILVEAARPDSSVSVDSDSMLSLHVAWWDVSSWSPDGALVVLGSYALWVMLDVVAVCCRPVDPEGVGSDGAAVKCIDVFHVFG